MRMIAFAAAGLIAATALTPTPAQAQRGYGWNDGRGYDRGWDRGRGHDRRNWNRGWRGDRGWNRGGWNRGYDRGWRGNRVRCVWVDGWYGPERRCYRR